jgi:aminopeptidase N
MMQDQMPTTHPIVADVPDSESARTNFDGISYAKGASVLKQLVAWVGEERFVKGVRQYFHDYEYGNANLADFLGALEKASGRDLRSWAGEWLETAGVNTFRARFTESGGAYASFVLAQTAAPGQPTIRSHRIAIGLYDLKNGSLVRRKSIELDAVGATTEIPELIGEKIPDLLLLNDEDLAYCKIRLDERSLATLTGHLADLADPLARVLCWAAVTDQLRDAELATRDFVRLVMNNVHSETDPGVVAQLLRRPPTRSPRTAIPQMWRRCAAHGQRTHANNCSPPNQEATCSWCGGARSSLPRASPNTSASFVGCLMVHKP